MDAVVVNQDTLHLEISLLAIFLLVKLNEGILQTVAGALVPNDLARQNRTKAAED